MMGHFLVAAPHKSSGKTILTLGICAALTVRGRRVQAFKKGPDFIDPMWLGMASGRPCYNLDLHLMQSAEIRQAFARRTAQSDIAIIEGNMGLFDSLDVEGTRSSAALAALLGSPVVLVVDARGMTRSIAPLLLGFQRFDPSIRIAGVILNQVAGARHETRLREAIAHYTELPVLGAVHRDPRLVIDERHLGLIPSNEADEVQAVLRNITAAVNDYIDLDALEQLAATAVLPAPVSSPVSSASGRTMRIGIARDRAFGFYYPDDLEALQSAGAQLVPFDTLHDSKLPEVDGLFIGGGFPETQMDALAENASLRQSLRAAIEAGLPAYAECGGLMYLSRSVSWQGRRADMVGIIPADTVMSVKPVGRGYTRLKATGAAPWSPCPAGVAFDAHEFHYSRLENLPAGLTYAYEVERGAGVDGRHDGIVYKNLVASYAHLRHLDGSPWAGAFVDFVRRVRGLADTA